MLWLPNKPFKLQVFIRLLLSKSSCNNCSIFAQLENFNSKRQGIFIPPQTALQWHPRLITLTPIFLLPHARKYDNIHENSWQFHFFYNLLRQINIHSNISLLLCLNFLSFLKFRNMMINMVNVRPFCFGYVSWCPHFPLHSKAFLLQCKLFCCFAWWVMQVQIQVCFLIWSGSLGEKSR